MAIQAAGALVLRYGLVLVVGWIGLMKFTGYEAKGIEPLVVHSPFMSWIYSFLSVETFSESAGCGRSYDRSFDRSAILVGESRSARWCWGCDDVSKHAVVLIFDTGMGTEPRWVSGALGISRTVPVERRGIAGSGTLVAW